MPLRAIELVQEEHTPELMAVPGVVGVYIGALDDGTPCIKVMVVKASAALEREIPAQLEGHPVVIEETGVIRPMGDEEP